MKRIITVTAGLAALAFAATAAAAAPLSGIGAAHNGIEAGIVKVHGFHRSCELGRWGWHRSTWRGRISCLPRFQGHWRDHHGRDDHHDKGKFRRFERRHWN